MVFGLLLRGGLIAARLLARPTVRKGISLAARATGKALRKPIVQIGLAASTVFPGVIKKFIKKDPFRLGILIPGAGIAVGAREIFKGAKAISTPVPNGAGLFTPLPKTKAEKIIDVIKDVGLTAGLGAGAVIAGQALIPKIKERIQEPKAPALVSPIPTPLPSVTAPTKQIIETPPAIKGTAIPSITAKPTKPTVRRKRIKPQQLNIRFNPTINNIIQNIL